MNIIQVQDRLKGLPQEMLVNYVKNPTGDVPIYLALGELNRRKEMKARFEANEEEKDSVKDQIVAEAKPKQMQMGIGAMDPRRVDPREMQARQMALQRQMTPEMLASRGVGALPTQPIQLKEGGIIGYTENKFGKIGPIYEDGSLGFFGQGIVPLIPFFDKFRKVGPFLKNLFKKKDKRTFKEKAKDKFESPDKKKTTTTTKKDTTKDEVNLGGGILDNIGKADKGIVKSLYGIGKFGVKNPLTTIGGYALYNYFNDDGTPKTEEQLKNENLPPLEDVIGDQETTEKPSSMVDISDALLSEEFDQTPEEFGDAQAELLKRKIGTDETLGKVATRLDELDKRAGETREDALNRALIMGGLTMAGTDSPDFLSAVAEGGMKGAKEYGDEIEKAKDIEDKAFELDLAIAQAKRKEDVAIATFGVKSGQAEKARRDTIRLQNSKLKLQKANLDTQIKLGEITSGMYGYGSYQKDIGKQIMSSPVFRKLISEYQRFQKIKNPTKEQKARMGLILKQMQEYINLSRNMYKQPSGTPFGSNVNINVPDNIADLISKNYSGDNTQTSTNTKTSANPKTEPEEDGMISNIIDSIGEYGGNFIDNIGDLYDSGVERFKELEENPIVIENPFDKD